MAMELTKESKGLSVTIKCDKLSKDGYINNGGVISYDFDEFRLNREFDALKTAKKKGVFVIELKAINKDFISSRVKENQKELNKLIKKDGLNEFRGSDAFIGSIIK